MTNSHSGGKQSRFNVLIPPTINTGAPAKQQAAIRNRRSSAETRRSRPAEPTGRGCRRSADEIPARWGGRGEGRREEPIAYGGGDQEAANAAHGAGESESRSQQVPSHFLYGSPGPRRTGQTA